MSTEGEEAEVISAAARGDRAAMGRLYELYRPMIRSIAAKFKSEELDHEDLMQHGAMGLMNAVRLHVAEKGRFSTYAHTKIAGAIMDAVREARHLPRKDSDHYQQALEARNGRVSIDTPQADDVTPAGILSDPATSTTKASENKDRTREAIRALRMVLDKRSASIVLMRMLGMSLEQIGERQGLRSTRVSQIMAESQEKMEAAAAAGLFRELVQQ